MNILTPERNIDFKPFRMAVKGKFTVELIHSRTGLIKRRLEFDNLITDVGLDFNLSSASTGIYAAVGTGSTAPAVGNTALVSEVTPASSNRTNTQVTADVLGFDAGSEFFYRRITRSFSNSQGNGNLTEIGLFSAVTGGTLWSRQLLKDGGGTPTTIVKTSDDELRITYEMRMFPGPDITDTVDISSTTYDYTLRPCNTGSGGRWESACNALTNTLVSTAQAGQFSETNSATTRFSTYTGADPTQSGWVTNASYSSGTFYRDVTVVVPPASINYVTGIGRILFGAVGSSSALFIMNFNPTKIPKDNTKRLTYTYRWALAHP